MEVGEQKRKRGTPTTLKREFKAILRSGKKKKVGQGGQKSGVTRSTEENLGKRKSFGGGKGKTALTEKREKRKNHW